MAAQSPSPLAVSHLTCEGLVDPPLLDTPAPRFSWRLESSARGARQTAFQVRVIELAPDDQPAANGTIETPRIASDQSQWFAVPGFTAKPRACYQWQVRVWDEREHDSGWSAPAKFATGLLGTPWPANAAWLGDGRATPQSEAPPARYFRGEFELPAKPARARLYLSAFGAVEPWLNGRKVGDDYFLPGWPDYRRRTFYVAYDVTDRVQPGRNALGFILAEGWFSSTLLRGTQFGAEPLASAFLELTDAAGKVTTVATSKTWQWAEGPIAAQAIYYGETFDARRDDPNWCAPASDAAINSTNNTAAWTWHPVQVQGGSSAIPSITAHFSPPVRRIEELKPVSRREVRPGVFLYDLGQNMVGWARLKVRADAGQEITLRFAEMLEADGSIHTRNLRTAHATATYVARGGDTETWEPRFTFFGFRYVELSGLAAPTDDAITGIVVHSDLPRIGFFECSNPLLNKLYANTLWGQKGNFLEVPTDCPQRDERLGWTGDAQVFCHTANYNFASGSFYRQWLESLRDGYRDEPNGLKGFPDVAPDIGLRYGSAGWGDAAVIIPYVTWLHTGDRRLLEENFDAMQQWVDAQARDWPDGIRRSVKSYGDWLAPGFKPAEAPTPYTLIATAYFAHVADIAGRVATQIGRTSSAERDRALFEKIRSAFQREYVHDDATIESDEQTAYLLALGFDLTPAPQRPAMVAHLVRTFAAKNDHLATGFLGTPLVTPVLADTGHADLAYRVLEQETYPGWLFSVKNGATTVWERWDSWTPEQGFHPEGMNSFNHYAYGSVVGWLYDTIAGLKPDASAPGWKFFHVAPTPGGGLTFAKASVETPFGLAVSDWKIVAGRFELAATIPPNTTAEISLPAQAARDISENGHPLSALRDATKVKSANGRVQFVVPAGTYKFSTPAPK
ncbi:MAG TPA: family 78 glycoside hydrolase catalytic domain [Opitutaceae bacterium]|nr:family 78 glycoside hydrolase catalytic domain [Opitutaceae bacterium]